MALLTTYGDTQGQPFTLEQKAGTLAFLLERFTELFGGVVEPPTDPTVDTTTGQFTAPQGDYLVSYS